jgi:hypothetical protein
MRALGRMKKVLRKAYANRSMKTELIRSLEYPSEWGNGHKITHIVGLRISPRTIMAVEKMPASDRSQRVQRHYLCLLSNFCIGLYAAFDTQLEIAI